MTTSTVTPEIAGFARAVRDALADLSVEEREELTDGLEADLAESLADDRRRTLPVPAAYAAELRAAAELPMRPNRSGGALAGLVEGWRSTRDDLTTAVRRNPALAGVLDFLVALRPAWWLLRAWVAFQLTAGFFGFEGPVLPYDLRGWIIVTLFSVVSVQWGRKRWSRLPVMPVLIVVGNVVAAIALLPLLAYTSAWSSPYDEFVQPAMQEDAGTGITLDGESVTNIFGYGPDGTMLRGVQIFDQRGRPLVPHLDPNRDECLDANCEASPDGLGFAPTTLETGQRVTNVFPLSRVPMIVDDMGEATEDELAKSVQQKPPFIKVPAVQKPEKVAKSNE